MKSYLKSSICETGQAEAGKGALPPHCPRVPARSLWKTRPLPCVQRGITRTCYRDLCQLFSWFICVSAAAQQGNGP